MKDTVNNSLDTTNSDDTNVVYDQFLQSMQNLEIEAEAEKEQQETTELLLTETDADELSHQPSDVVINELEKTAPADTMAAAIMKEDNQTDSVHHNTNHNPDIRKTVSHASSFAPTTSDKPAKKKFSLFNKETFKKSKKSDALQDKPARTNGGKKNTLMMALGGVLVVVAVVFVLNSAGMLSTLTDSIGVTSPEPAAPSTPAVTSPEPTPDVTATTPESEVATTETPTAEDLAISYEEFTAEADTTLYREVKD